MFPAASRGPIETTLGGWGGRARFSTTCDCGNIIAAFVDLSTCSTPAATVPSGFAQVSVYGRWIWVTPPRTASLY